MPDELQIPKITADQSASVPGFVLVVDDEEQNRSLLRDSLEARGFEVAEAENGRVALQKVAERQPDAILLDLMMPEMDGFEACRRLKGDLRTAHIPILMVTALSERKERLQGIESGANDFLNKPIDIQDVVLRVRNSVSAKHLHDRLQAEQARSEKLLLNILPAPIAERMKRGETNIADNYPNATVLVASLVGFTTLASHISPEQIVHLLNEIFSAFDVVVEKHGLEKIKTIGDAYMVVGGVSLPLPDHARACAGLASDLLAAITRLNDEYNTSFRLRIGICTGPVIAGVIGRGKFAYDLWGETVNTAWRLEETSEAGRVQVSESTRECLKNDFHFGEKPPVGGGEPGQGRDFWLGTKIEPAT